MPTFSITQLAVLALAATQVVARDGPARFHAHGKRLVPRQFHSIRQADDPVIGAVGQTTATGGGTTTQSPGFISIPPIVVVPATTTTSTTQPVSAPPPVVVISTSTAPPPSSTTDTRQTTSSVTTVTSSRGPSVVDLTLTSVVSASFSLAAASASASSAPQSSSGIGQGTVIAIVVVASSCAGVFLLWTIFRRWKLKPTRNFEDRLQPIDFSAGAVPNGGGEKGYGATGLKRSGSGGSDGSGSSGRQQLYRKESFGSLAGSQGGRTASERGGGPRSETGSRAAYQPSYPPGSNATDRWASAAPAYSPPQASVVGGNRLANPYSEYEYGARSEYAHPGMIRSDTIGSDTRFRDAETWNHRF